jgi:hypothetical protein
MKVSCRRFGGEVAGGDGRLGLGGVRGAGHALVVVAGPVFRGSGGRGVQPGAARLAVMGGLGVQP